MKGDVEPALILIQLVLTYKTFMSSPKERDTKEVTDTMKFCHGGQDPGTVVKRWQEAWMQCPVTY